MAERIKLLNAEIDNLSLATLLERFTEGSLVTPNLDHMMLLQKSEGLWRAYQRAEFITVDSQILFLVLKLLGRPALEKISGSDFLPAYCHHHRDNPEVRVFLLGAGPGVAARAAAQINARTGREIIVGHHSPSMGFVDDPAECDAVIAQINASEANVLVVGLGAPKQEIWIDTHRHRFTQVRSFMALGATLDFEAGEKPRAPRWMSRFGLEWLYRLIQEPGRLWRRYLVTDTQFFWLVLKERLGLYRPPAFSTPPEGE